MAKSRTLQGASLYHEMRAQNVWTPHVRAVLSRAVKTASCDNKGGRGQCNSIL